MQKRDRARMRTNRIPIMATLKVGEAQGKLLEEQLGQKNAQV